MASIKSISELAFRQLYPNPGDETGLEIEDFIETAKSEYAWQMQLAYWAEKQRYGEAVMPSHLLVEKEMPVVDNEIDISELEIFRNLSYDCWLQNVGGVGCSCKYVKSDVNMTQLMCGDDSLPDDMRPYYPLGDKIKFPKGAHAGKITIIYASKGENIDDDFELDDGIAAVVRTRLIEIYGAKTGVEDVTNNTSSEK